MTAALVERDRSRVGAARTGSRTRPKLRVLNQQAIRQRARRRHALVALFIVVLLGFFAVAFVHAELVADQQQLDGIRTRIAEAEAHNAKIERAVEERSSPKAIVKRAQELGMVRAHQPVYLAATAPVRDVPAAVSFRSTEKVVADGVASPDGSITRIAVGISAVATVKIAASSELATPPIQPEPAVAAHPESASTPVVQPESDQVIQTKPDAELELSSNTPSVGGSSAIVSSGSVVSGQRVVVGGVATPASTDAPSGSPFSGASTEQTPTSIAGTRAVSGGGSAGETVSQFGGTNAGTGNG